MTQQDALQQQFDQNMAEMILENRVKHPLDWKTADLPATEAMVSTIKTAMTAGVALETHEEMIPLIAAWEQMASTGQTVPGFLAKGQAGLWIQQHIYGKP